MIEKPLECPAGMAIWWVMDRNQNWLRWGRATSLLDGVTQATEHMVEGAAYLVVNNKSADGEQLDVFVASLKTFTIQNKKPKPRKPNFFERLVGRGN